MKPQTFVIVAFGILLLLGSSSLMAQTCETGCSDCTTWKVHDWNRPRPAIITPPTASTQDKAGTAPSDAIVLFDGSDMSNWRAMDGGVAKWIVNDDYMESVRGAGYVRTLQGFGDCQLHVEFRTPTPVKGESQGRGNSGVFMMAEYEIQVLDCYDNPTYADGTVGAIYGQCPPLVNAARQPGAWQVYDIIWEGPRFDWNGVCKPAYVTVILNGLLLHHRKELRGVTSHRVVTEYKKHDCQGPLMLQDHNNPTRFRNIWYRNLTGYDEG